MIRLYLKQSWELIKQNRLFSALYIAGTGLAIAMTMIMAIVYYVKIAPVYPEVNRSRTLYITNSSFKLANGGMNNWAFSLRAVRDWFYKLENVEVVSAYFTSGSGEFYIQPFDNSGDYEVQVKLTDPAFFKIYDFHFLGGKPFTDADLTSGIRSVVITDELARRLFGSDSDVTGRTFQMDYQSCRVVGVVRSASYLSSESFAQIYMPYTCHPDYANNSYGIEYMGGFSITVLVESAKQEEAMRSELNELIRKCNQLHAKDWTLSLWEQPTTHLQRVFKKYPSDSGFSWAGMIRHYVLILLVLLLVPALNLSGMISSRMESRLAEMGVRKSFGACRRTLLHQVMWENFLMTLLGGALGLVAAWVTLFVGSNWIFSLFEDWPGNIPPEAVVSLSGEMLFAPAVFLITLLMCILLNMLSALIPAWRSLRKPIVYSLNEKK